MNKKMHKKFSSLRFVDLCAGIGGISSGLMAAGWKPIGAFDLDRDAISVHQIAHGFGHVADVLTLSAEDIGNPEAIVAGFPCQPFSSSGNRSGFNHKSGNVFEAIVRLVQKVAPRIVILENVQGLLSNGYGFTFANVLLCLTRLGYEVSWSLINGLWYGAPQDRRRVVMIATYPSSSLALTSDSGSPIFQVGEDASIRTILGDLSAPQNVTRFNLADLADQLAPAIGKPIPKIRTPFLYSGVAKDGYFSTWKRETGAYENSTSVGEIICPDFRYSSTIRSVRYWGHSGITKPYIKKEPWAHCVGTNIGAAPTFACKKSLISTNDDLDALLKNANWKRDEVEHIIFRINPEVSCRLFGNGMESIEAAFQESPLGSTKKYVLLGNSVIPEKFRKIALSLSHEFRSTVTDVNKAA